MKLSNLKPANGAVKNRKRVGRGTSSGRGGTSTRGHKGAKSRSGYKSKRGHEGGQMPIQMRLPKRGFKNTARRYQSYQPDSFTVVNLNDLQDAANKMNTTTVDINTLVAAGLIKKNEQFKVLAQGELTAALQVSAFRFSKAAKTAIEEKGGSCMLIVKANQIQGIAEAAKLSTVGAKELAEHFKHLNEDDKLHVIAEGSLKTKFDLQATKVDDEVKTQIEALGAAVSLLG